MKSISVGRFIGIQITILIIFLITVYSLTIDKVYQWGTYDTTHYFLSLEADRVLESIQSSGNVPAVTHANTSYYLERTQLPKSFNSIFPVEQHIDGELLVQEVGGSVIYLLPYENPNTGNLFYVSSAYRFSDDNYEVNLEISELQILLALFSLILLFFLVKNLAFSVILPIRNLEKWATSISNADDSTYSLNHLQLRFTELESVAQQLNTAVTTIEKNNKREKNFLRTLSHELRTPLAITKAALELLRKDKNELDKKHQLKLDRMQRANDNMLSTSESLLWLWTRNTIKIEPVKVNLCELTVNAITLNKYLLSRKTVEITQDIQSDIVIDAEKSLLKIVINNLIRNAFQYTARGLITIAADSKRFEISNPVASTFSEEGFNQGTAADLDYGYGIGLYLVNEICVQREWPILINSQHDRFTVSISFTKN